MDLALYAPGAGYYTRERDPFGSGGDFYTAEQLQPVFGILIARIAGRMASEMGTKTVLEFGAGRREMASAFGAFEYHGIEQGETWPEAERAVVFANELFDAMPVHLILRTRSGWRERAVTIEGEGFAFARGTKKPSRDVLAYLDRYHGGAAAGSVVEVNLRAREWVATISRTLTAGRCILIDYGYTAAEWPRHSHGTLMSYRRHTANEDVLASPGERDITAHVAWTPLQDAFGEHGWHVDSFHSLARTLLDAGEEDQFRAIFEGCDEREELRRRMQLKTLLFGMGETFRVLKVSR